MARPEPSLDDIRIRDVEDGDIALFFAHQLDPEASRMAAFPSREQAPFMAHWAKIRADEDVVTQTIVADGEVVGNLVSWEQPSGKRAVGYWIDRRCWGRGVATRALALFLDRVGTRPLHAYVAATNVGSIRVLEKCGFQRVTEGAIERSNDPDDDVEEATFILETLTPIRPL